jgi:hypothetical protein
MNSNWIEMNNSTPIPDRAGLRIFGLMFAGILAALFGLLIPLIRFGLAGLPLVTGNQSPAWPWWVAALLALVLPQSLVLLYKPWMKFAVIAQWINTRIILLILYYLIILPIGLIRRLLGKDSMQRKFDPGATTYRTLLGEADHNDMEKPY